MYYKERANAWGGGGDWAESLTSHTLAQYSCFGKAVLTRSILVQSTKGLYLKQKGSTTENKNKNWL